MFAQVVLVVLLSLTGCYGFFPFNNNGHRQVPICVVPTKPCRLKVMMYNFNGTIQAEMETQDCSCWENTCSSDWSRTSHVISRSLISSSFNFTLMMMFCNHILPPRFCNAGEESLEVSGSLEIPQNVVNFACRCNGESPLLLHRRWVGSDHLIHHAYVCDYFMATCPRHTSHCLVMESDLVTYQCKCPCGRHCRPEHENSPYDYFSETIYGTCRD